MEVWPAVGAEEDTAEVTAEELAETETLEEGVTATVAVSAATGSVATDPDNEGRTPAGAEAAFVDNIASLLDGEIEDDTDGPEGPADAGGCFGCDDDSLLLAPRRENVPEEELFDDCDLGICPPPPATVATLEASSILVVAKMFRMSFATS